MKILDFSPKSNCLFGSTPLKLKSRIHHFMHPHSKPMTMRLLSLLNNAKTYLTVDLGKGKGKEVLMIKIGLCTVMRKKVVIIGHTFNTHPVGLVLLGCIGSMI